MGFVSSADRRWLKLKLRRDSLGQRRDIALQGFTEPAESDERDVSLSPLDAADIRAIQTGVQGKLFLRQAKRLPAHPDPLS